MREVILSAAKNPEVDGGVYEADIAWILHPQMTLQTVNPQ
jgi:hypothetical protein